MTSVLVLTILLALALDPHWWIAVPLVFLPWPIRVMQLTERQRRRGLEPRVARASGTLLMVGKLPQFLGLLSYYRNRMAGRASRLIEYKGPETV